VGNVKNRATGDTAGQTKEILQKNLEKIKSEDVKSRLKVTLVITMI
jgi:hypothetical protein